MSTLVPGREPLRVFKYRLPELGLFELALPSGAEILHFDSQGNSGLFIWALVDPEAAPVDRRFRLVGTGHPVTLRADQRLAYVGSTLVDGGNFVFHLFEVIVK
jgi:hypothetical protein